MAKANMRDVNIFLKGFRRFKDHYFDRNPEIFEKLLAEGQRPRALMISCCDSRCDPGVLMDSKPGDLFVVRNVANLVPPLVQAASYAGTSSAIAFAVCNLGVEHIIVMGHARCGGIRALMENKQPECDEGHLIAKWLSIAADARQRVLTELPDKPHEVQARACEQAAILKSLENLMSYPWVSSRVKEGRLALHGWYFDMENGALMQYDSDAGEFRVIDLNLDHPEEPLQPHRMFENWESTPP
ncbi:MAG: carbonic anhydrase [Gallionellaceae bacterium]|nr:carbonic anhydrase [Gallionellaceae bacterium]